MFSTRVWKFPKTGFLRQSLLFFSAYHLQSQIVYWISNIGLSGSQYAGGGRGAGKWSKIFGGNEDWWPPWLLDEKRRWQDNLTVHRLDESGKKHLQFRVGQNNVMLSDGGKKYGGDGSVATRSSLESDQLRYWQGRALHVKSFHSKAIWMPTKAISLASF